MGVYLGEGRSSVGLGGGMPWERGGRRAWSQRISLWAFLALAMAMVGCGGVTRFQKTTSEEVAGVWADEGGLLYTFVNGSGGLKVTTIEDVDGELFVVQESGWQDTSYSFTYLVPSTQYVVTIVIDEFSDGEMSTHWSNVTPSGESFSGDEVFVRTSM